MLILSLILLPIPVALPAPLINDDACGKVIHDRIVGGRTAALGQFPWIARLGYRKSPILIEYECGGALITRQHVLSAAHCVTGLDNSKLVTIVLGEHDDRTAVDCEDDFCADPPQIFAPVDIAVPAEYNHPPFEHDIALIRLDREAEFSAFVRPICLPTLQVNLTGQYVDVAGWGWTDSHEQTLSHTLQTVKLQVTPLDMCRATFESLLLDERTQICVGGEAGKDSCAGDSGGPMQKVWPMEAGGEPRYFVMGIVSLGSKSCGEFAQPAIYTNVFGYLEWIKGTLK